MKTLKPWFVTGIVMIMCDPHELAKVKILYDLNREISCWLDCWVRGDLLQKQWILRNEIALTHDSGLCPLSPAAMISLGATRLPFRQCAASFTAEDQQRRGFLLFWHPYNLESCYIRWHKGSFFSQQRSSEGPEWLATWEMRLRSARHQIPNLMWMKLAMNKFIVVVLILPK